MIEPPASENDTAVMPAMDEAGEKICMCAPAFYNFVVYKNVMELSDNVPVTGYVKSGEYSYFIYQSHCENCSITFGLSSYSNGNPDMYIVKVDGNNSRLPTQNDYDFKKATLNSEILTLNLDTVPNSN